MKKKFKPLIFIFLLVSILSSVFAFYIFKSKPKECSHSRVTVSTLLPTCASDGKSLHQCNDCSYSFVTNVTPRLEHSYSSRTVAPTCFSEGYTLNSCVCGDFYISETIPKAPHELSAKAIEATCSSQGYTEYTCEICNYFYKDSYTDTAEHSYVKTVYLPTALKNGYTEYLCACSDTYKGDEIRYSDIASLPYVETSTVLARGIDVSRWNHQIDPVSGEYLPLDWQKIKAEGFNFVIIKAGSTRSGKEPTFESDYAGARAAGLMIGAYYYTYSQTKEQTVADATALLEYLNGKQFEYPIYFDLEDPSLISLGSDALTALCESFICTMQENGYYSALYTNNNWLYNVLNSQRILSLFDIWYARYPEISSPVWNAEKYGRQLSMWQYTQTGEINGIDGFFDMNFCYRDYPSIMQKWGLNGYKSLLTE